MAGNSNSGKRAGGRDFGPRVRSIFDRVLEKLELRQDADKLMEKALLDDFVGTIQKMSQYAPKQVDIALEQTVSLDTTKVSQDILQALFEGRRDEQERTKRLH